MKLLINSVKNKFFISFLVLFFLLFSCLKDQNKELKNLSEDIIYSDSFSPEDWENPLGRKNSIFGDKDIGVFISEDTVDPKLRTILLTIDKLFKYIKENNKSELENLFTKSCYNSFNLRYSEIVINDEYKIRVEQPSDINLNNYWLNIKIIFSKKSFYGKIQLEFNNNQFLISDFDNNFFDNFIKDTD